MALIAISPDMLNEFDEKLLIYLSTNEILMRPSLGEGFCKYPLFVTHKLTQAC